MIGAGVGQAGADWPHAFGPAYDGHVERTNLVWPWTKDQPNLLWQANLGEGYSGMSVAAGRLYTQAQRRDGQYVICLDVETGQVVWQTRYNYPWQLASEFPDPYATPTFYAGHVFYADCHGFAGCLDAQNGKAVWTLNLTDRFGGTGAANSRGLGSTLVDSGGDCSANRMVVARDRLCFLPPSSGGSAAGENRGDHEAAHDPLTAAFSESGPQGRILRAFCPKCRKALLKRAKGPIHTSLGRSGAEAQVRPDKME